MPSTSSFPTALDDFPDDAALEGNPPGDVLGNGTMDHTDLLAWLGSAIEQLEAAIGITGNLVRRKDFTQAFLLGGM